MPVLAETTGSAASSESPAMTAQVKEIQDSIQALKASMEMLAVAASNSVAKGNSPELAVQEMISAVEGVSGQLTDGSDTLRSVDVAIKDSQATMNEFKKNSVDVAYSEETRADFETLVREFEPTLQRLYKVRTELTKSRVDLDACKKVLAEKKDVMAGYAKLGRAKELATLMEACVKNVQATVSSIKRIGGGWVPPPQK